jgi:hypothetical protein
VAQSKDFTKMVKDMQDEYTKKGFSSALPDDLSAKKPMKAAKKGTLKEKNDSMMKLLNTVVEKTEGMNEAWEHFASANPAFSNVASYRCSYSVPLYLSQNTIVLVPGMRTRPARPTVQARQSGTLPVHMTRKTLTVAWTCLRSSLTVS